MIRTVSTIISYSQMMSAITGSSTRPGRATVFSATNSLISNLKKKPSQRNQLHYVYKGRAINECAAVLGPAINPRWLTGGVLVPMPPSKIRTDADDDRVAQICRAL